MGPVIIGSFEKRPLTHKHAQKKQYWPIWSNLDLTPAKIKPLVATTSPQQPIFQNNKSFQFTFTNHYIWNLQLVSNYLS